MQNIPPLITTTSRANGYSLTANLEANNQTIKVGVIDGSELIVHGYQKLFANTKISIINAELCTEQAHNYWKTNPVGAWPKVILIAANIKQTPVCTFIPTLQRLHQQCKIIVVSHHNCYDNKLARFIRAGADGYISILASLPQWLVAIDAVLQNKCFIGLNAEPYEIIKIPSTTSRIPTKIDKAILFRVMEGYSEPQHDSSLTADELRKARQMIFKLFKVKNHLELTKLAIRKNFILGDRTNV